MLILCYFQHPDLSEIKLPPKEKKFQGYYKIARHYKWAMHQMFIEYNHQAIIIIEGQSVILTCTNRSLSSLLLSLSIRT